MLCTDVPELLPVMFALLFRALVRLVQCCLLGLPLCAAAWAQPQAYTPVWDSATDNLSQYKLDLWQTEQGLPLNTVQALLQTRDGYLWVGTAGGLARFDGLRFTRFNATEAPAMASEPVFALLQDREQRLWVGHSRGAAYYEHGQFRTAITPEQVDGRRVWGFAQAPDGAVWAASEHGLLRWQQGRVTLYQQAQGLPTNKLRSLVFDREGTLWIATTGGGLVAMRQPGRFEVFTPDTGFPHLQVRALLADPEGGIWAATAGAGLVHWGAGAMRRYTMADGLPTDHLTALARDAQGHLWIGTWGEGVVRWQDGRFSTLGPTQGLAGGQIWSLGSDREGSVWVGTWVGGLNRLRNRPFTVVGAPEGLSHDNTRAVLHARSGTTWVATAGGGLSRLVDGRIEALGKAQGLPTEEMSSLIESRDGSLWVGTYTSGVLHLDAQGRLLASYSVPEGLPGIEVRALYEDRQGQLWVGTRSGLARRAGTGFEPVTLPGMPQEGVLAITQGRDGTLWFAVAGQGLVSLKEGRYQTLTRKDGLVSNWVVALYEDARGSLWIGSNGEGMNRLRDGRLSAIRSSDGLWDGLVQVLVEDRQGQLWMSCNRGFSRVALSELDAFAEGRQAQVNAVGYGPGDALRTTTFAGGLQGAGALDKRGRLWLPSSSGLVIVDPKRLPGEGAPPAARIEAALVQGRAQALDRPITLPHGATPLLLRYTAMTLRDAERVRFRTRLDGLNDDWIEAGSLRETSFPGLPHGQYRFRVQASTDGQHWQEAEQSLSIEVRPQLHETAWFRGLLALAVLAGFAGLLRWRTHALQRRQSEMERLVAQRTEELRQANEHLSRLSYSDALTGLANRRCFDEALAQEWRRARRQHSPLALLIADIDAFKRYNDMLGHPSGDACLKQVAAVFQQATGRAGDLAARYGGEEFVVLLPGATLDAARALAEQLRAACEALAIPHPDSPVAPVITLSLGAASCVPAQGAEGADMAALMAEADAALYRAKQQGRNRVG